MICRVAASFEPGTFHIRSMLGDRSAPCLMFVKLRWFYISLLLNMTKRDIHSLNNERILSSVWVSEPNDCVVRPHLLLLYRVLISFFLFVLLLLST